MIYEIDYFFLNEESENMNPTFVSTASVAVLQQYIQKNKTALHSLNETGHTALHTALIFQRVDVMKMLLDAGGNVYAKSSKGWTVLDLAATEPYCQNIEIKTLFQEVLDQQRKQVEKMKQLQNVDSPTPTHSHSRIRSKSPRKKRKRSLSPSLSPSSSKKRHSVVDSRIYLDDLPIRTSHEDLWHFFTRHVNEPRKVNVRIRQPQRVCFGFVEFKSKEDAQKARELIQSNQLWFRGTRLHLDNSIVNDFKSRHDRDSDRKRVAGDVLRGTRRPLTPGLMGFERDEAPFHRGRNVPSNPSLDSEVVGFETGELRSPLHDRDSKKMIPSSSPASDPVTFQPMGLLKWIQQINPQLPAKDCLKLISHPQAAKWMASPMGILDLIRQIKPKASVEECWKIIGELKGKIFSEQT
jgi:hypothetical protein